MPGAVQNAAPSTVLPAFLCSRFVLSREWATHENAYLDGSRQATALTTTPRRKWELSAHIPPDEMEALRDFLFARKFLEAFYFYSGPDTVPPFSHDPTGVVSVGRFTVVARGRWAQQMGMARGSVDLALEEVT